MQRACSDCQRGRKSCCTVHTCRVPPRCVFFCVPQADRAVNKGASLTMVEAILFASFSVWINGVFTFKRSTQSTQVSIFH